MTQDSQHNWTLWIDATDGTGRLTRYCQECGLRQYAADTNDMKNYE